MRIDYDAPVEGLQVINDYEFKVILKKPVQRFAWILAMPYLSVVPHEAVEYYDRSFGRHPVGTGPFTLRDEDWTPNLKMTLYKNPNYHECYYPTEHQPEDKEYGFHLPGEKKTRLPIVDRVELPMFQADQPMWLKFQARQIDYTEVPAEYYPDSFVRRTRQLRPAQQRKGLVHHEVPLLDFIFRGFNMDDPILGGNSEKHKNLRRAISLAVDWEETNEIFYNGQNVVYDGMIPPGLDGYPKDGKPASSYRGPDLNRARELLAKAGYPGGKGLPKLEYYTSKTANSREQAELLRRQLGRIGVEINVRVVDFPTLMEAVDNRQATLFGFAWGSDYPDAENNLALFYGPNASPGANHFNYNNP